MSMPSFDGPQATSFSTEYASSLRNSQVMVKRKHLARWSRQVIHFAPSDGRAVPKRAPPFLLVVSPSGHHGAFSFTGVWNEFLDEDGLALPAPDGDLVALDAQVFAAGEAYTWDRREIIPENGLQGMARVSVRRITNERFVAVATEPNAPGQTNRRRALIIAGGVRGYGATGWDWGVRVEPSTVEPISAVAAVDADLTVVVALNDGRLQVYPPVTAYAGKGGLGAERNVDGAAKFVSIVGPRILLIIPDSGGGRLMALTGDTTPLYSLSLPFEVLQPAIAGAKGRIYLAGKGLAAIDDRKVIWTHPSDEPVYASSFEDGSLAVALDKRLDFLKTDGTVIQSFDAEEPLVTPPAIAADGSVWVASTTALYIAR